MNQTVNGALADDEGKKLNSEEMHVVEAAVVNAATW